MLSRTVHLILATCMFSNAIVTSGEPSSKDPLVVHMNITDPKLGEYRRTYHAHVPDQCRHKQGQGCPVLLWFHGWCGDPVCDSCGWIGVGKWHSFVTILPLGMADGPKNTCISWNVDAGGRDDICVAKDVSDGMQYDSCKRLGLTGPCNTLTCYDDVHFVQELVASLPHRFNVDLSKVYAAGGSNGGMFVHHLVGALAKRKASFRLLGIAPWYGAFYQGALDVPDSLVGLRVVQFQGLKDVTIPANGGEAFDGGLYTPLNQTLDRYARMNACLEMPRPISTPFDGVSKNFHGCWAYQKCKHNSLVARCDFDSPHGFWETYSAAITWWFLAGSKDAAMPVALV